MVDRGFTIRDLRTRKEWSSTCPLLLKVTNAGLLESNGSLFVCSHIYLLSKPHSLKGK